MGLEGLGSLDGLEGEAFIPSAVWSPDQRFPGKECLKVVEKGRVQDNQ